MYLFRGHDIYDLDFDNLAEIAEFLDGKLSQLCNYSVSAFQTYMTDTASCAGKRKHEVFKYGAKTPSGASKVQIVNAAANYWKHREEWVFDDGRRQKAIDQLFEEVGYSTRVDYPISGVLTELLAPAEMTFASLLTVIRDWRDDLIAHTRAEQQRSS